jgi:hypothetical protein
VASRAAAIRNGWERESLACRLSDLLSQAQLPEQRISEEVCSPAKTGHREVAANPPCPVPQSAFCGLAEKIVRDVPPLFGALLGCGFLLQRPLPCPLPSHLLTRAAHNKVTCPAGGWCVFWLPGM